MENMDKGITVPKWALKMSADSLVQSTQNGT